MAELDRGRATAHDARQPDDEVRISLAEMLFVLLEHIRPVVLTPLVFGGLAVVLGVVGGRQYEAQSSFVPQVGEESQSAYQGLAAQFGIALPGTGSGESVQFYAELVRSATLLRLVAQSEFWAIREEGQDTVRGDLAAIWGLTPDSADPLSNNVVEELEERTSVRTDLDAGIVRVTSRARDPNLAVQVNRQILESIQSFNRQRRQSIAAAERHFIEARLEEARRELLDAEDALEDFLKRNRTYQSSPELAFEAGRLQRRIDLRQQVFNSLTQAYEESRIEEVRNTPLITIIDRPEDNIERRSNMAMLVVIFVTFGAVLGVGWAFVSDFIDRHYRQDAALQNHLRHRLKTAAVKLGFSKRASAG